MKKSHIIAGLITASLSSAIVAQSDTLSETLSGVHQYRNAHEIQIVDDFKNLLAIPNVSSNQADMIKNADWITEYIGKRGFTSEVVTAGRAPYIIAERKSAGANKTVLIYAHFDGQPVEPANWASNPFEPILRDDTVENGGKTIPWQQAQSGLDPNWRIFARSAGDDKAPVIALMAALDALSAQGTQPSVNIKLILDGEEEAGSPTLEAILKEHASKLDADIMLFCDGPMHQSRQRQLVFGVRGSMTLNMTTYGPNRPLHSGHYGNWAPSPTDRMVRILNTLKDETGRIIVDNYWNDVRPISKAEQIAISNMPSIDAQLKHELALGELEGGGKRLETLVMEPAIIIKGLQAGGVEDKSRNIIIPEAKASLNMRLVPDQTPAGVKSALEQHFKNLGYHLVYDNPDYDTLRAHQKVLKLDWVSGAYPAFRTALDSAEAKKLTRILNGIGGDTLLTPTMGGSLPIYLFENALDMPIIMLPIANHDNNQHGKDENLRLQNLWDAIDIYASVLLEYGK
ncbi:M20/M25/M40 family metallo-hydrolase [Kordiimonas sp. SCSIO 12610]|uniref:M20/M25/M40 family metallo-hydrolase n=1 Tax=Kordiimonas sp. SCSIO 12610 TaxID=2829597 RepID=UPI00210D5391|nr:M20/M25/M40 family metallo-hydrolase [Kordiimonas sp. SCSIO 12610]UTW54029.1 M20/M25/M40 family metallo-hydrolase [Kordiimonas sp. SCSIO 12610]